jgi:hypothetical protein
VNWQDWRRGAAGPPALSGIRAGSGRDVEKTYPKEVRLKKAVPAVV